MAFTRNLYLAYDLMGVINGLLELRGRSKFRINLYTFYATFRTSETARVALLRNFAVTRDKPKYFEYLVVRNMRVNVSLDFIPSELCLVPASQTSQKKNRHWGLFSRFFFSSSSSSSFSSPSFSPHFSPLPPPLPSPPPPPPRTSSSSIPVEREMILFGLP